MQDLDNFLKEAKDCHTKEAWENFFSKHHDLLSSRPDPKVIADLFKLLKSDPQSLHYSPEIWGTLISATLNTWGLDTGEKIAKYVSPIPCPKIGILSAQVYMERGEPVQARQLATRALRLKNIETWERLQLQMIVCNTYVEEGKQTMALRLLEKMEEALESANLEPKNLADLLLNMGRARFFLGQYLESAKIHYKAYELHLGLKNWESAARGLFNAAANYHNTGQRHHKKKAFELLEQCRKLTEEKDLKGAAAHCHAFLGTHQFQLGKFKEAIDAYKRGLKILPESETRLRRLSILSMLALAYLRNGQFQLAGKFGRKTLELANDDKSQCFWSRYLGLEAELEWAEGDIKTSQKLLENGAKSFFTQGVQTLEEIYALGRFYIQSAELNQTRLAMPPVKIAEGIKASNFHWPEYMNALAQLHLTKGNYNDAQKHAMECYTQARDADISYLRVLGLITLIQNKLAQKLLDEEFRRWKEELEAAISDKDNPLRFHLGIIDAALAYHEGSFKKTRSLLEEVKKLRSLNAPTRIIVDAWLATSQGHSPKLHSNEHLDLVARATRVYFAPSIEVIDSNRFLVSDVYTINLERQPILAQLLHYLLSAKGFSASPEQLQASVWQQSLTTVGWRQKIRNTIMRLRESFPYTVAPLILHSDNQVRIFQEAIQPRESKGLADNPEDKILQLLQNGPMSSVQLSNSVNVSQATTKRILKRLAERKRVHIEKQGRNVLYYSQDTHQEARN